MTGELEKDLAERVRLIESMIVEGRQTTERWAGTFVLWGVAYYIAAFWSWLGRFAYAWPVTMAAAAVVTMLIFRRRHGRHPATTMSRAIGSIWTAMGLSMFIVLCAMGYSSRFSEGHSMVAVFAGMVGLANAACGMILKWRAQLACAAVWWAAAVAACYCSDAQLPVFFLLAVFLGQIVFGIYGMICEARRRRLGAVHV